jgi:hypothetical protein
MFKNITEAWGDLTEQLNRPFYSEKEAMQDRHKNFSQISKETELETPYVTYDPFNNYSNSFALGGNAQPINHGDFIRRWRESSLLPEVDEALIEITSEAIVFDEIDPAITLNLDDIELTENIKSRIYDSFDKIIYLLDFNEKGEELFRQWYVDSTLNFEVVYNNRKPKDGIQKLILLPPFNIQKYKNEHDGTVRWYIDKHSSYNPMKDLENPEITYFDEQIASINSGIYSPDKNYYYSPIQKAMKSINQLYLLEDTLIIHRLTKSTEKRAFYIDTGNLPKTKAEEYMKSLISKYRQKKVYNTENGTVDNAAKSISILEDFWFPINSQGKGTRVEPLNMSNTSFSSFEDVDYFVNKVYSSLCVPKSRRNAESKISINPTIDIERDEMKFFKYIQKLRRKFNNLFVDLLKKDLIARQVMSLDDWKDIQEKIKFVYASSNEISMLKKAQIIDVKVNGANNAMGLATAEARILSPKYIQEKILRMSDEEVVEIAEYWSSVGDLGGGEADALGNAPMGGGPAAGGEVPPDFQEVPGAGGAQAPQPGAEAPVPETPASESRFRQKAQESGLSKDILESLEEGDIITDGKSKLIFEKGKLRRL